MNALDKETKQKLAGKALSGLNDSQLLTYAAAHLRRLSRESLADVEAARETVRDAITEDSELVDLLILSRPTLLNPHLT